MYHYEKLYQTKGKPIKSIDNWIYYDTYVRYQKRFEARTLDEVRSEVLASKQLNKYHVLENKRIIRYKQTHYISSTSLTA